MATSIKSDKDLSVEDQGRINDYKNAYNEAKTQYNKAKEINDASAMQKAQDAMNAAHADAEKVRAGYGYTGGTTGADYSLLSGSSGSNGGKTYSNESPYVANSGYKAYAGENTNKSTYGTYVGELSAADSAFMSKDDRQALLGYKADYRKAKESGGNYQQYNDLAEQLRNKYGYTGGADGVSFAWLPSTHENGFDADYMRAWVDDYKATNYNPKYGWTNMHSTEENVRSQANYIRQLMEANDRARQTASEEDREYLHNQNLELAKLLPVESVYDPVTGRWGTWNPSLGYGDDLTWTQQNLRDYYYSLGLTDEDQKAFNADTSRYYNFLDASPSGRYYYAENNVGDRGANAGYFGPIGGTSGGGYLQYGHYNQPRGQTYVYIGDKDQYTTGGYSMGNKDFINNNSLSDYQAQFTGYPVYGVIQPGLHDARNAASRGGTTGVYSGVVDGNYDAKSNLYRGDISRNVLTSTAEDPHNIDNAFRAMVASGAYTPSGSGGGGYSNYLEKMYAAALEAQTEALRNSYEQNLSNLDAEASKAADSYTEQKRQATGQAERDAAAWREMANAYGLNSGAVGQAALAQNNQIQSDLNTLSSAQAAAEAEIERQRTLLGQEYQSQINQAIAQNNYELANALYQEAVRAEQQLLQQQQYYASLGLQYAQFAADEKYRQAQLTASSGGSSGGGDQYIAPTYDASNIFEAVRENQKNGVSPEATLSSKNFLKKYGFEGSDSDALIEDFYKWLPRPTWKEEWSSPAEIQNQLER